MIYTDTARYDVSHMRNLCKDASFYTTPKNSWNTRKVILINHTDFELSGVLTVKWRIKTACPLPMVYLQ